MDSDMDTDIPVHIQTNGVINIATEKQLRNQVGLLDSQIQP